MPECVRLYNEGHTWAEILEADGWTWKRTDYKGVEHWIRPGKNPRENSSATVGHKGADMLYMFSSSVPWLEVCRGYDKWGYMVFRDYAGDFAAAVREETDILNTVLNREQ